MGAIDNRGVCAPIEQQSEAVECRVLCGQMHRNGLDTVAVPTKVMFQVWISAIVEQPGGGLDLVRIDCLQ